MVARRWSSLGPREVDELARRVARFRALRNPLLRRHPVEDWPALVPYLATDVFVMVEVPEELE